MFTKHLAQFPGVDYSSVGRISILHANELYPPIFRAAFRRRIAGDRPSVPVTFGAQAVAVYAMIREPVRYCLRAIARQFQIRVLGASIVGESLNANLPVGMLLQRGESFVQCGLRVWREVRFATLEMYVREGDSALLPERSADVSAASTFSFMLSSISVAIQLR
jgi:hypothetical protein